MNRKKLYSLIYRIRKSDGEIRIDTRRKLIFFDWQNPARLEGPDDKTASHGIPVRCAGGNRKLTD